LRAVALGYGLMLFVVTATYLVSSIFRSATTVMGLSLGMMMVGTLFGSQGDLPTGFGRFWPAKYYMTAQNELLNTSQGFSLMELPWLPVALFGLALAVVYSAVLAAAALVISKRRDVVGE